MSEHPFDGLRVLDLGHHVAGPYCTKILADLGADVIKVERPGGDPLRGWGPFPGDRPDPDAGGLFRYLNANKRSVVLDLATEAGADAARALAADADLVVENFRPGTLESFGLGFEALREANALIALVRISNFGQTGPCRDLPATDLVIQAAGGWVQNYAAPGADPVRVGGRMAEHVSGAFAACAAVTAVHAARRRGEATLVDLSIQETLVGTLPYSQIAMEAARKAAAKTAATEGARGGSAPARFDSFGIVRCKDGWVGINILTDAHWAAACRVAGAPEYADSRGEVARNAVDHDAFSHKVRRWLDDHTAEEILEQCQAARIPTAIVASGKSLVESSQSTARPFFVEAPGGGFRQPAFPYRMTGSPPTFRSSAPALPPKGAETPCWHDRERAPLGLEVGHDPDLPFRGLRVLDLGTFWAGPYMAMYLASLGADVVKIESTRRPDGFRFLAAVDLSDPDWYEAGALFQGTNHGKRDITLDLGQEAGRSLLLRLVEGADVFVENFAPRVLERFGLDYDAIRSARPDIVMVRMPAFGLVGPWRDHVGWAMAIAQAAGISWLTGDPADDVLRNPGAFLDPAVAMHATVAVQAALAHRRHTGEGQMIETAQLETAACMCAEPVIDYSMNAHVQEREGNRSRASAPQGVYACRGGAAVALSVQTDAQWRGLMQAMDDPLWAESEGVESASKLASAEGRREHADEVDAHLRAWTADLAAGEVVERLREHRIPAAAVLTTPAMYGEPQLEARDYYQTLEHPITGKRRYPVWPMRFSFHTGPAYPAVTSTLGQHNDEILGGELGLAPAELARLREQGVIGERWKPPET